MTKSVTKTVDPVIKNDTLTYLVIFLTIALTVGYLVDKNYKAIVLLYFLAVLMYFVCKNVLCSLGISIILTNLFLTLNKSENFETIEQKTEEKSEDFISKTIKDITDPLKTFMDKSGKKEKEKKEKKD
tara:strand:+ start:903 stop:1286 length:384 start_codon:yes stop_codon:yes gene_type:complete